MPNQSRCVKIQITAPVTTSSCGTGRTSSAGDFYQACSKPAYFHRGHSVACGEEGGMGSPVSDKTCPQRYSHLRSGKISVGRAHIPGECREWITVCELSE